MVLLVYGSGGFGMEVMELAERLGKWEELAYINDFEPAGKTDGWNRMPYTEVGKYYEKEKVEFIIALGEPKDREALYNKIKGDGYKMATLISDTALVSKEAKIGEGCIINDFVAINTKVVVDSNSVIQQNVILAHEVRIGKHSVLSMNCAPGGRTTFGSRVYCGMNSSIKEKLVIGDDVIVAMGAAVFSDVEAGRTVVGNPARVTISNTEHKVFYSKEIAVMNDGGGINI